MDRHTMYEGFAITLCEAFALEAKEAKALKDAAIGTPAEDFQTGYLCGYHRIVTLIQQQAEMYDIPLSALSMDQLEEKDLV